MVASPGGRSSSVGEYMDEQDYPAAHSMDTTWFAVDKDGYLAVLETGVSGPVPLEIGSRDAEEIQECWSLSKELGTTKFAEKAIYRYTCDSEWRAKLVESYERVIQDAHNKPMLKFEDLDKVMQEVVKPFHFRDRRFAEAKLIQPALVTPCAFYELDIKNPVAIDEAGNQVRIPKEYIDPRCFRPYSPPEKIRSDTYPFSKDKRPWWKKLLGRH